MPEPAPSDRCSFRLLDASDGALLSALDADPAVMKYINGGVASSPEDIERVAIPRLMAYRNPDKGWGLWGVFERTDNNFLGWVLVRPMHFFSAQPDWQTLELGWRFRRSAWGKGYATETAKHLMQWLHNRGVKKFCAIALPDNQSSINVMKKLGMHFVSRQLHHDPLGDAVVDYYALSLMD